MHEEIPRRTTVLSVPLGRGHALRLPNIGLSVSERRVALASADLLFVNLALVAAASIGGPVNLSLEKVVVWLTLLSVVWLVTGSLFDIYDLSKAASPIHSLWAAMGTVAVAGLVYILIPFITPGLPDRRLQIFVFAAVALTGVTAWRVVYATVFVQPQFQRSVLVIGAGWAGRTLAGAIAENAHRPGNPVRGTGYHIIGFVDDDPQKQNTCVAGIPVLGTGDELNRLVAELKPDKLVIAVNRRNGMRRELTRDVLMCYEQGLPVTSMAELYERVTGRVPIDHAGGNLAVVLPVSLSGTYRLFTLTKRLVDIAVGVAGCLATVCVLPFIWLGNRLLSPGDLFFRQTRMGIARKPYQIIKFRSMVMDAEKVTGAVWAEEADPRVTPIGRWLRKTRLDELPQSWNILVGDMSLIGPRPERPEFVQQLVEDIPHYGLRHAVKPGLTGWAQVKYRYGASAGDARTKLEYDLYYIKNQSLFLDFSILLKTVNVVLGLKGR